MMTKDEALKMAYDWVNEYAPPEVVQAYKEALEQEERTQRTMHCGTADAFIAMDDDHKRRWFVQSLRESKRRKELEDILEQPAQSEYMVNEGGTGTVLRKTAPSWQGLSDDEIWNIANFLGKNKEWDYPVMFAKTIEQALKEKNYE